MNRALLKKCINEAQWLFLACAAALFAFCWFRVWVISHLEMSRFKAIVENFRDLERFSPIPFDELFSYTARVGAMYSEPLLVICFSIFAISRGTDAVSGEIGRGTMEMLLAQPVSRLQVLATHAAVTLSGVFLLTLVVWLGMWVGIETTHIKEEVPPPKIKIPWTPIELPNPLAKNRLIRTPLSEKINYRDFLPGVANLGSLGIFLAGLSTFASSLDRHRWRTIGLVVGFYVIELIFKIAALASDNLAWLSYCSIFTAYEPEALISVAVNHPDQTWAILRFDSQGHFSRLGPLGYDLILFGLGAILYIGSAVVFCKRDLPAPL